jgi:hypothetical protein
VQNVTSQDSVIDKFENANSAGQHTYLSTLTELITHFESGIHGGCPGPVPALVAGAVANSNILTQVCVDYDDRIGLNLDNRNFESVTDFRSVCYVYGRLGGRNRLFRAQVR